MPFRQEAQALRLARILPKARFVASHPHSFLVLDPHEAEGSMGFDTAFVDDVPDVAEPEPSQSTLNVLELVKSRANPFADRISIGRAPNCDVVLADPSVSKLHAHVRESNGELVLVDVGSQNGTTVNGQRLERLVPQPIRTGDRLQFGSIRALLADAASLHDLVHAKQSV